MTQSDDFPHQNHTPARELYDDEEWEMLQSFENGEWLPDRAEPARLEYWRNVFRQAYEHGYVGPVDYDVPYPWSSKAGGTGAGATDGRQNDDNDNGDGGE